MGLTFNVSTRIFHTTNAPIFVALPFTSTLSVTCTLRAQHALFLSRPYNSLLLLLRVVHSSSSSSTSLSCSVIAPGGRTDSADAVEMARAWPGVKACRCGGWLLWGGGCCWSPREWDQ